VFWLGVRIWVWYGTVEETAEAEEKHIDEDDGEDAMLQKMRKVDLKHRKVKVSC